MKKFDLNLPVGKFPEKNKWLSMDDYIEFVNFCMNNFPASRISKKEKAAMHVDVPFSLR